MIWLRWLILLAVPTGILMAPVPAGLTVLAWKIFAVYCAAILGLILQPAGVSVTMLTVIAFGSFVVPLGQLLSGYSNGTVWLVFSAFLITQAFVDTGLGKRIAYWMIGLFGKSSLGLVFGQLLTDLILSPATPSNTARSGGIVYPIFRNVAITLGSEPGPSARKIGSYITIAGYTISLSTSMVFLTACAPNILTAGFAKDILKVDLNWIQWFIYMSLPALLCCVAAPLILYRLYPPELKKIFNHKQLSEDGLKEMGPMTYKEKILLLLFILAVIGWATSSISKIAATAIALLFFSLASIFRLIKWENVLNNNGAWNTLIWYGAIMGLSGILAKNKFFVWLAKVFGETFDFSGVNQVLVLGLLLIISILVRYVFASMGAYVAAFIPVLFTVGLLAKAPAIPLMLLIAASSAYGCLLTHYGGAVGPVMFGTGYVPQKTWWKLGAIINVFDSVVFMTVGLLFWKVLGLW
ncbi:MAG: DASS family sodium-coupled anion symporter [Succiniclasticum sp.]|nr:DASS family sodium-coupled anion symporter [Succiniclasticum sp.]MDY6086789.1 DASS family sodium-coupled anion symporter [Succiniclasticum sp.]